MMNGEHLAGIMLVVAIVGIWAAAFLYCIYRWLKDLRKDDISYTWDKSFTHIVGMDNKPKD